MQQRATKKQQELLSFVDGFITQNGYGPSYREIMNALGYKSVSTVAIHVDNLIAKGHLARSDKSARSLEVVGREHVTASKQPSSTDGFEAELLRRIADLDVTDDQRAHLNQALALLNIKPTTNNETSNDTHA